MPTYEYQCADGFLDGCDRESFEVEQRITDPPLEKCPHCGGKVKRLIPRSTRFQLRGSGWARDGYGS
jgi:putative FmdB family regulatory protein